MNRWCLTLACMAVGCGGSLGFEEVGGEPVSSLLLLPNIDDDDTNGRVDWRSEDPEDDEVYRVILPAVKGGDHELSISGDTRNIRVYAGGVLVLDADNQTWSPEPGADIELGIELRAAGVDAVLTLTRLKGNGEVADEALLTVAASEVFLQHHLRPAEHVWLMDVDDGRFCNNQHMVQVYGDVLGDDVTFVSQFEYAFDVWVQDEMQLGSLLTPSGRHDFVLDSIRDGGLDGLPKSLEGADAPRQTHGDADFANTYDSFGNLEVSPPVTVDGVEYPLGRIYYGDFERFGPTEDLSAFLADQQVQKPFQIDTSWLCVGHVDEFVTFVPDPEAPKGFRMIYGDATVGMQLLDDMDPSTTLPRYARTGFDLGHGRPDVASIVDDRGLRALNEDIQATILDPIREQMIRELGLSEEDIVPIPMIFEEAIGCGGAVVAMTPGMVNLVVVDFGDKPQVFLADPFLRDVDEPIDQDADPYIQYVRDTFPSSLDLHFVDDWFTYHMALGEVHCGTNERRTPTDGWWDLAAHLKEAP